MIWSRRSPNLSQEQQMTANALPSMDSRFTEEGDWIAQHFFSPADLQSSPEEYVARHAHALGCFSFHLYRYRDAALGVWVRRVGEILSADGEVERCRERFLSREELATTRQQQSEEL
jgi:hypothetical protein